MKVYIAGCFESKARLELEAARLERAGYTVLSSWLKEQPLQRTGADDTATGTGEVTPDQALAYAGRDLRAVKEADLFILDTLDINVRGGREVEFGISLTRFIRRYIVGPNRNVFHEMANRTFDNWGLLHAYLRT